jgi:hypothetical protein
MVPLDALLLKCVYSRKFRGVAQWLGHLLWEQDIEGSSPFAPIHEGNQCWLPFFMETEKYSLQEADLVYHIRIAERRSYIRTHRREYD